MLKNVTPRERKTIIEFELVFDDGANNGFGFPCDAQGNLLPGLSEAAHENLEYAMQHPEKFVRFNKVVKYCRSYTEPARGTCSCGAEVELWDQYYGACQCEKCGQWYNLYGQELVPPDQWETDPSEEEYDWEPYASLKM